jgi:holo-[acyl-carrier protein] synthase
VGINAQSLLCTLYIGLVDSRRHNLGTFQFRTFGPKDRRTVSFSCLFCRAAHTRLTHQMHRIRFPSSLNIGTDIVYLPRIRRLVSKQQGRRIIPFAKRILHSLELGDLAQRHPHWRLQRDQAGADSDSLIKWLGGRFAAKEAARKALGASTLGWKDVRVEVNRASGQPCIVTTIQNANNEAVEHEAKLSISHDGDYVVATVLAAALPETGASSISKAAQDGGCL